MKLDIELTEQEMSETGVDEFIPRNPIYRTAYGPRIRVGFHCEGDSMTKQSERDLCDINKIIAKYHKTGMLPHANKLVGSYLDLQEVPDFHAAMNVVTKSQEMFMALPSSIRNRFGNDPASFVDFVSNPENISELQSMGLIDPPEPTPAEPVAEPVEPPAGDPPADPVE